MAESDKHVTRCRYILGKCTAVLPWIIVIPYPTPGVGTSAEYRLREECLKHYGAYRLIPLTRFRPLAMRLKDSTVMNMTREGIMLT